MELEEGHRASAAPTVVALAEGDLPAAAETLATAFRDNPLNLAVIGEPAQRRLRANRVGNRASLAAVHGLGLCLGVRVDADSEPDPDLDPDEPAAPSATARAARSETRTRSTAPELAGVLVAEPPGIYPLPPPPVATQLRVLWKQGWRVATGWSRVHVELQSLHPHEPHWVLDMLGVAPPFQGRGIGTSLLRALLERVDADGAPSYLETDRRENVAFYRRASYTVLSEERVAGVPVWRMWREPQSR